MLVKLLFYNFFSLTNFSILEFNAISAYLVINHWVAIGFSIFLKLGKSICMKYECFLDPTFFPSKDILALG